VFGKRGNPLYKDACKYQRWKHRGRENPTERFRVPNQYQVVDAA
jgi:hypothetical protein